MTAATTPLNSQHHQHGCHHAAAASRQRRTDGVAGACVGIPSTPAHAVVARTLPHRTARRQRFCKKQRFKVAVLHDKQ